MMELRRWLEAIEALPSSTLIRESTNGYPALLSIHVIGMCLFAGLVLMMDLRLLGIGTWKVSFSELQTRLFPWQLVGMIVSAVTGLVLVYGQPTRFFFNIYFWLKMVMMALAAINLFAFHQTTYRFVARWDDSPKVPSAAFSAAMLSVILWAGVIVTGRLIAYNWFEVK